MKKYITTIGLEFHAELMTKTKIFCSCPTTAGTAPNRNVCPICLGMPGTLPSLNRSAVELAARAGMALNCEVASYSKFDRKNYFYPDLPKGYQVTQFPQPICKNGWIEIIGQNGEPKKIRINRIHMEEDAGKLVHSGENITGSTYSLPDYNRGAMPLIEIVTEPDISSAEEARDFGESLKAILDYAQVSDVKMEMGSLRCDVNISIRPEGTDELGTRAEVKNLNSFRSVYRTIKYEEERQAELLEDGGKVIQETRLWDDVAGVTRAMRSKEDAHDYRYFPEPDLLPVVIDEAWMAQIRASLPELPAARRERLQNELGLSEYDARQIVISPALARLFDQVYAELPDAKLIANWLLGDISRLMRPELSAVPLDAHQLAYLLQQVRDGAINNSSAKTVLEELFEGDQTAEAIIASHGFAQISDSGALERALEQILAANPQPVADYRAGKKAAAGFLVGQVMKATKGQANAAMVKELLEKKLAE